MKQHLIFRRTPGGGLVHVDAGGGGSGEKVVEDRHPKQGCKKDLVER